MAHHTNHTTIQNMAEKEVSPKELLELASNKKYDVIAQKCNNSSKDLLTLVKTLPIHHLLGLFVYLPSYSPPTQSVKQQPGMRKVDLIYALLLSDNWMVLDTIIENGYIVDERTRMFLPALLYEMYKKVDNDPERPKKIRRCFKWLKSRSIITEEQIPSELKQFM